MFKNKSIILIIIIIALSLIAWGLSRGGSLNEQAKQPQLKFSSKTDKIEIDQKERAIILVKDKETNKWQVEKAEIKYPANQSALDEIIKFLEDFKVSEIISQNPDKYKELQVDEESGLIVKWFVKDKEEDHLTIGKSDYSRQGDYIRIGDQPGVYLTSGNIRFNFSRPEFRDLNVLSLTQTEIKKIAWNYKDQKLEIQKIEVDDSAMSSDDQSKEKETDDVLKTEKWFLIDGDVKQELDESKVSLFLNQISNLSAQDMLVKTQDKDYGFTEPYYQLTVSVDDKDYTLTFGAQADEAPAYYAQISERDEWVYLVNIATVENQLAKKAEDFEI